MYKRQGEGNRQNPNRRKSHTPVVDKKANRNQGCGNERACQSGHIMGKRRFPVSYTHLNLFKETIAEFMENGLEAELDDELGYSKYDYKNKDTDNSRNGHSSKTLRTSFGDVEVSVPRDRKGEFEPQVLKKNQTSISQDIEEKILSMYAKGMTTGAVSYTHLSCGKMSPDPAAPAPIPKRDFRSSGSACSCAFPPLSFSVG